MQRPQLVVLLASDDLVRPDDLFADTYLVLCRRHRATHVVASQLRCCAIGDDRRMKESAEQPEIDAVANDRCRVGVDQPRPTDQHRERLNAVGRHPPLVLPTLEDDVTADVVERATRRNTAATPALENALHGAEHGGTASLLRQIRRLVRRQGDPLRRGGLLNSDERVTRVAGRARAVQSLCDCRELPARRIERRRHVVEHRLDGCCGRLPFLGKLRVGLGNAECERRDDVVRCDRADLVYGKVDRGRRGKEHVCEHSERQCDRDAHTMFAHPRASWRRVAATTPLAVLTDVHPAARSASCRSYARTMSRTRRWRTTSLSSK